MDAKSEKCIATATKRIALLHAWMPVHYQNIAWYHQKVGMASIPKSVGPPAPALESTDETRVDWI
jgi:hypothetical protein